MDRYEKLWAVVVAARAASATIYAAKVEQSQPISREDRDQFSETHGRAFFSALLDFFGDQDTYQPTVRYFMPDGKINTRSLSALREAPDQQVIIRLAADMIAVDKAPLNLQLIPEFDQFSERLENIIV